MAAGKAQQSNAMLYTVIAFVGFFILSTVLAVVYYNKYESEKVLRVSAENTANELASRSEQSTLAKTVGKKPSGTSYLGAMNGYLNEMVQVITGQANEEATAAAKVNDAKIKINATMELLGIDASADHGEEGFDLLQNIAFLKSELDAANELFADSQDLMDEKQQEFDAAVEGYREGEEILKEQAANYQAEADTILESFNELKAKLDESTDAQLGDYQERLEKAQRLRREKEIEMVSLGEELDKTLEELNKALAQLEAIKPHPDVETAAFIPDASVISSDIHSKPGIVVLDKGSDDHVYIGLTFSIYDPKAPLSEDGKGKAEVEVFRVRPTACAARVLSKVKKQQPMPGDTAVNLIWNSGTSNSFAVAGEFDFNGDGQVEEDGKQKIEDLILRWGGQLVNTITINTDFVIIGEVPEVPEKPTQDEIEIDPASIDRYDAAMITANAYHSVIAEAQKLNVPTFNRKRFLNLVGFESTAKKSKTL